MTRLSPAATPDCVASPLAGPERPGHNASTLRAGEAEAGTGASSVVVRLYAAAADAAGTEQLTITLSGPVPLGTFLAELPSTTTTTAPEAPSLTTVCARSSFLINGTRAKPETASLGPGDQLDILPPFAGG